jgi:hypothetical protein
MSYSRNSAVRDCRNRSLSDDFRCQLPDARDGQLSHQRCGRLSNRRITQLSEHLDRWMYSVSSVHDRSHRGMSNNYRRQLPIARHAQLPQYRGGRLHALNTAMLREPPVLMRAVAGLPPSIG